MVKRKLIKIILSFVVISYAVLMLLPIVLTILHSFGIGFNSNINFTLEGYKDFFLWKPIYLKALFRSIIISASSMIGSILIAIPAAYIFAKGSFFGKNILYYIYIIIMIMPF